MTERYCDHLWSVSVCLQIEKKLLVSARTLLEVTQDEVKREKLRGAISTHESNVQALRQQLAEMKGMSFSGVANRTQLHLLSFEGLPASSSWHRFLH